MSVSWCTISTTRATKTTTATVHIHTKKSNEGQNIENERESIKKKPEGMFNTSLFTG